MSVSKYKNIKKVGLGIICFEGTEHLYNIISAIRECVDYVVIGLQRLSYHGDPIQEIDLQEIFRLRDEDHLIDEILEIELDTRKPAREQETDKRNMLIQDTEDHGCSHTIIIDSDEYYTKKSFEYGLQQIDEHNYEITYCQYVNYYHDYEHYLKYPFTDGMFVPFVTKTKYRHSFECQDFNRPSDPTRRYVRPYDSVQEIRDVAGGVRKVKHYTVDYHIFDWNEVKMHHLSWIRADIRKKLNDWSSKLLFDNYEDLIDKAVYSFNNFNPDSEDAMAIMLFNTPENKVEVARFPKQFIFPKVDINTRLRPVKHYKKVIFLSMSADIELFNKLEEVSNETWRNVDTEKYPNVNAEFWTYTDTDKNTYVDQKNHIIYVKKAKPKTGNLLHATYSKTIEALNVLEKITSGKYDYLVRTNNSTWINVPLVCEFISRQSDDSLIYSGRLYAAFHSAFNVYPGGNFMVYPKREVNILLSMTGTVAQAKDLESKVVSCDDNMIGGQFNNRMIMLGLKYKDVYHTIGEVDLIHNDIDVDIDFTSALYQVKTYENISDANRMVYDIKKMYEVDKLWKQNNDDISELCDRMIEKYYDKTITVLKESRKELFEMSPEEVSSLKNKDNSIMSREEAFKYLPQRQKELGYARGAY